jgi:putative transposase
VRDSKQSTQTRLNISTYLIAIIDWATRRVPSWRLSNTLTAGFCVEALSEALARFGKPGIFNTDQGAQFTSEAIPPIMIGNDCFGSD